MVNNFDCPYLAPFLLVLLYSGYTQTINTRLFSSSQGKVDVDCRL